MLFVINVTFGMASQGVNNPSAPNLTNEGMGSNSIANLSLYPGEKLINIAGYPELTYFLLGEQSNPLVVFVPGGYNLARIAYGTPNTKASDYIAYWFHQKGFSFLGLSYPLDNPAFKKVYPEFNIQDWANQIVESAKLKIETEKLPKTFVMLGWSMAGKVVSQVNKLAEQQGLEVIYISLSSDPSIRGLVASEYFDKLTSEPTAKGLSSADSLTTWFTDQIHEQDKLNGHVIISDDDYIETVLGDHPVDLLATATRFEKGEFVQDPSATLTDTQAMNYDIYPMMGLIHGDSRSDYINALFTRFDWSPMLTRSIYNSLMKKMSLTELSSQEWNGLKTIISHSPEIMSRQIQGNHLFFLGEIGAKQTVTAVQSILAMKDQLDNISSPADLCAFTSKFQEQLQGQEPGLMFCQK